MKPSDSGSKPYNAVANASAELGKLGDRPWFELPFARNLHRRVIWRSSRMSSGEPGAESARRVLLGEASSRSHAAR